MQLNFDSRWIGDHGIGRFARVLNDNLHLQHLPISGASTSPFDPLRLLLVITFRIPKGACVFSPGYNAPLFFVRPYIFTIHDLNHIDRLENSSFLKRLYYRLIMRRACRKAFRVLTVSEFSRQRIIAWAGVDADHVVNVSNGVDESYRPDVQPYEPGYAYLLCVSNRKAHKNESRVLEAFVHADIDPAIRLVFTGQANEPMLKLCQKYDVGNRVVFAGRVLEQDLPGLYRGAIALVFPSLYEGFGLPVIEAMACGTPVITSNTTSLPEVAGEAALLVDPLSVEEISEAIEQICKDKVLRETLRRNGLLQAARFPWNEVTKKVKSVLNDMEKSL
ncbi:MAG: glycosyltransferase family 4 protein [Sulfuriferula sp.]